MKKKKNMPIPKKINAAEDHVWIWPVAVAATKEVKVWEDASGRLLYAATTSGAVAIVLVEDDNGVVDFGKNSQNLIGFRTTEEAEKFVNTEHSGVCSERLNSPCPHCTDSEKNDYHKMALPFENADKYLRQAMASNCLVLFYLSRDGTVRSTSLPLQALN